MADPNHPFAKVTPGQTYAYFEDMGMKDIVDHVEKVDAMTVKFVLKKPEAPFMADMAMDFASILSAEYADKMMAAKTPDVIDREPIGTGPFQFVSYQKDAVIRYKAFDPYWGGRPKIDNLVYAITTDASVRYAKLKTGECHVMAFPKPADVALMKNDPAINLVSQQGLNVGYIAFNVEKKPFDSKLVRQALNIAVNKKAILDNVFQGAGQVAKNPIPPTLWSYNDKVVDYPYDPAKAKALLAQAGYPNGVDVELWYLPVTRPYNPDGKRMAELIQADWEKVGVRTKLITYEWGEYRKRSKTGEQHAMMFGWSGDNGDPDNFFVPLLGCAAVKGGGNVSRWCDKDFENLLQIGQAGDAPGRPRRLLRQGAGHRPRGSAVDHDRALGALRPDPEGSHRLQDGRHRPPLLQQGRHARSVAGQAPQSRWRCAAREQPHRDEAGQEQRERLRLGHCRHRIAAERERGVERPLVGDVGADAQPVGIEGVVADPALQVGGSGWKGHARRRDRPRR